MKIVHFPDQLGVLKAFFDQGMTRRRLPLLAATKTGLSESMVENWLGNERVKLAQSKAVSQHKTKLYKRNVSAYNLFMRDHLKAKGVMSGTLGKWQALPPATKAHYSEEADKLRSGVEGEPEGIKSIVFFYI
uniref:uncharacterized protein zgc:113176 n=1 Tax=Oncorhynchus gorbuscha TaxID=8017 RepID=UPI001EAF2258|nr:uncharacterized protein zgc:113176 [Oncorhynchus gorbuscha]